MSVYHSPRCRIAWTNVYSDGVDRDVVIPDRPLTLFFGLSFDNNIRGQASLFRLSFSLITPGVPVWPFGQTWTAPLNQLPGSTGSIWVSMSWSVATDATRGQRALLLYRPTARFEIGGLTGDDEFAVAEEDHYIWFE